MSESTVLSKSMGMVGFVISLIYRLTVRLVVEFLKIGALLTIIFGSTVAVCVGIFSLVLWAYTMYDGSVAAAIAAVIVGVVMVLIAVVVVEFVVKDFLGLTDMPLMDIFKIMLMALWKPNEKRDGDDERVQLEDPNSPSTGDRQVKKTN